MIGPVRLCDNDFFFFASDGSFTSMSLSEGANNVDFVSQDSWSSDAERFLVQRTETRNVLFFLGRDQHGGGLPEHYRGESRTTIRMFVSFLEVMDRLPIYK